jgi:FkbM family methyltransferase
MPRLIHRAARAAFRLFPPLKKWDYLVNGLRSRFHPTDEEITVRLLNRHEMIINPADGVSYEIFMRGCYEENTVAAMRSMLHSGMTFFDIGTHFGQYTLMAAAEVGPTGAVHSFEPGPIQFGFLSRNVALNHCKNVSLNNVALSDQEGEMDFVVPSLGSLGQSHLATAGETGHKAQVITLDGYCEKNGIKKIDVMKVDVEGAEMQVFRGANNVLRDFPPAAIFYETIEILNKNFGYTCDEMHSLFESCGYSINVVRDKEIVPISKQERNDFSDFIALRR